MFIDALTIQINTTDIQPNGWRKTALWVRYIVVGINFKINNMKIRILIKLVVGTLFFQFIIAGCSTYKDLEKALVNPEKVTALKIRNSKIQELPPEISKLKNLKTLYLFRNQLTSIPKEIGELENLETLIISSNRLTSLPPEIVKLKKLKKLSLKHNDLKYLPKKFGNLTSLQYLDLQYNDLDSLPLSIGKLTNLKFLYLNNNRLTSIPYTIGDLESLQYFVIGKNRLYILPFEIGDLECLKELNLVNCGPQVEIPSSISNLKSLEFLFVDNTLLFPYTINSVNPRLQIIMK